MPNYVLLTDAIENEAPTVRDDLDNPIRSFATIADAVLVDLSSETDVEIRRWTSGSQYCPTKYKKVGVAPSHSLRFQDHAGNWWSINEDPVNVLSAGALGDGATNDSAAFQMAVDATKNSSFLVPAKTYYFATAVNGDQTQRMIKRNGASFTGPGLGVFTINYLWQEGTLDYAETKGSPRSFSAVYQFDQAYNLGGAGYGKRFNYWQTGTHTSGFSIADAVLAIFNSTNGGQGLANWTVAVSPEDDTAIFGVFCSEMNVVNLASDEGYYRRRGDASRWAGGIQIVPESKNLKSGGPAIGRNALYAFLATGSGSNNVIDNDRTKFYNGFMLEEGAIAPDGVGFLASGSPSATREPRAAHVIDAYWEEGVNFVDAVFSTGRAITFDFAHQVQWGDSGHVAAIGADSSGHMSHFVDGEEQLRVSRFGTTVSHLNIRGGIASGFVSLIAESSESNTSIEIIGKGTGGVWLKGQGGTTCGKFSAVANAVNTFNVFSNATGQPPTIQVVGTDTNVDLAITTQGTGVLRFGSWTSNADAAVNGYVTIKDAAGNVRKLATIA